MDDGHVLRSALDFALVGEGSKIADRILNMYVTKE